MKTSRQCARILTPLQNFGRCPHRLPRTFHSSTRLAKVKPFLLPDIGEGIQEVQIIQWFVEPEAHVEQFDKLCEVQSDKAAAEITSRFDGVIKKLHYDAEDMAQVGKSLADDEPSTTPSVEQSGSTSSQPQMQKAVEHPGEPVGLDGGPLYKPGLLKSTHASLATPAVRGLLKELNVDIADVTGTGKDGRVLKEDVNEFAEARDAVSSAPGVSSRHPVREDRPQLEIRLSLTPIQAQMFKTMTRTLSIPQFSYADEINLGPLSKIRQRVNINSPFPQRLSYLPFIIKAVSLALEDFPLLNSRVETGSGKEPPQLIMREKHNIGVAMDTPQGLLVPNIKNVSSLSIIEIVAELSRLKALAKSGKLSVADLTGGTITVSNIGVIGGTYVTPVIVSSEVAILGIGKARTVPAFDEHDQVVKKETVNFSWSADHRVVDGATMARMGERTREFIEEPEIMMTRLR